MTKSALPPLPSSADPMQMVDDDGVELFVSPPDGATEPRPVVVGVHGAGDRPDWSCYEWRATLHARAWVVCPRGFAMGKDAYAWGSAEAIALRTDRALATLRAKYAPYLADGKMTYGGWSQGATLASRAVLLQKGRFDTVVLVEIGYTKLDANVVATELLRAGVDHVVMGCSSTQCRGFAGAMTTASGALKLPLRVHDVGLRGHWFDEPMFVALRDGMKWATEGDDRWPREDR